MRRSELADRVAAWLAEGGFSQPITPERAWVVRHEPDQQTALRVVVLVGPSETLMGTRGTVETAVHVLVVVLQKVADLEPATLDPLGELVDEVAGKALGRVFSADGQPDAVCRAVAVEEVERAEYLEQMRVFVEVVDLELVVFAER